MTDPVNLSISPQAWTEETTENNNSLQSVWLPKYWFIKGVLIISEINVRTLHTVNFNSP